jgi:hypothetical protein
MHSSIKLRHAFLAAAALALALPGSSAAADGREGPVVFTDAALDDALAGLNDFLRNRDAAAAALADLRSGPPHHGFRTAARAVGNSPGLATPAGEDHGFGPSIGDGRSLDIHLASFSAELRHRGQDLFVRVIAAAATGGFGFAEVAHLPPVTGTSDGFGPPVDDDQSLDASMGAFATHMRDRMRRDQTLAEGGPTGHTGASFDKYTATLLLY